MKTLPERTALAKTRPGVKPRACQKAPAEDRFGRGTRTSRRQAGRRRVVAKTCGRAKTISEDRSFENTSSRSHVGHFPKTGRVKTCRREDTRRREDRSGEHTHRPDDVSTTSSDDSRVCERQCVLSCREVLSVAASCMQVHAKCCSRWRSYMI